MAASGGTLDALAQLLDDLVSSGRVSAVRALVGSPEGISLSLGRGAVDAGRRGAATPPSDDDLFDLASLTKPWSASLALILDADGDLPLGAEIGEVFPRARKALACRTLEDLLRHRSGLEAWQPLYRRVREPDALERFLLERAALGARRGTYSDLGFVLWGLAAERVVGQSLRRLFAERLIGPLGVEDAVLPAPVGRRQSVARNRGAVVACRLDNRVEVKLAAERSLRVRQLDGPALGVVQDGNARFLGGLAAHAGLFGSARSLWRLGSEWLRPGDVLAPAQVKRALAGTGGYRLGWRRRRRKGSAGPYLSRQAFGHVGFTGGSLWLDPRQRRIAVLLAHRTSVDVDLSSARRRFHQLVAAGSSA